MSRRYLVMSRRPILPYLRPLAPPPEKPMRWPPKFAPLAPDEDLEPYRRLINETDASRLRILLVEPERVYEPRFRRLLDRLQVYTVADAVRIGRYLGAVPPFEISNPFRYAADIPADFNQPPPPPPLQVENTHAPSSLVRQLARREINTNAELKDYGDPLRDARAPATLCRILANHARKTVVRSVIGERWSPKILARLALDNEQQIALRASERDSLIRYYASMFAKILRHEFEYHPAQARDRNRFVVADKEVLWCLRRMLNEPPLMYEQLAIVALRHHESKRIAARAAHRRLRDTP